MSYRIFFARGRVQDINPNQMKLKEKDTYEKGENITTNFEPSNPENILSKAYLDTKLAEV